MGGRLGEPVRLCKSAGVSLNALHFPDSSSERPDRHRHVLGPDEKERNEPDEEQLRKRESEHVPILQMQARNGRANRVRPFRRD